MSAAPVRIRPRIGPAHGAQSNPVPTPNKSGEKMTPRLDASSDEDSDSRSPSATSGLVNRSARPGNSNVTPNKASTAIAAERPYALSSTTQPPPSAASEAMAANETAMPINRGSPCERKGRSARANTNGSTGRMQGLRMVSTPPR